MGRRSHIIRAPSGPTPRSPAEKASNRDSPEPQEVVAVSQNRNISLALALALLLSTGALAPPSALGNRVLHDPAPAVNTATTPAPDADSDAADNPDQPKHKESGLARVLAAPFRGFGGLLGGGPKKSKAEGAKRSPPPAPSGDGSAQAGANAKQESADAK